MSAPPFIPLFLPSSPSHNKATVRSYLVVHCVSTCHVWSGDPHHHIAHHQPAKHVRFNDINKHEVIVEQSRCISLRISVTCEGVCRLSTWFYLLYIFPSWTPTKILTQSIRWLLWWVWCWIATFTFFTQCGGVSSVSFAVVFLDLSLRMAEDVSDEKRLVMRFVLRFVTFFV